MSDRSSIDSLSHPTLAWPALTHLSIMCKLCPCAPRLPSPCLSRPRLLIFPINHQTLRPQPASILRLARAMLNGVRFPSHFGVLGMMHSRGVSLVSALPVQTSYYPQTASDHNCLSYPILGLAMNMLDGVEGKAYVAS